METGELNGAIARSDAFCSMLSGMVKALEYGLRTVILSHPYPDRLNAMWQAALPEIAGAHLTTQFPDPAMFDAGMQQTLRNLTGQIEMSARRDT